MAVTPVPHNTLTPPATSHATAPAPRPQERARTGNGSAPIAAQSYATGHGSAPARTGAQPLNATGRGRIVNIVV